MWLPRLFCKHSYSTVDNQTEATYRTLLCHNVNCLNQENWRVDLGDRNALCRTIGSAGENVSHLFNACKHSSGYKCQKQVDIHFKTAEFILNRTNQKVALRWHCATQQEDQVVNRPGVKKTPFVYTHRCKNPTHLVWRKVLARNKKSFINRSAAESTATGFLTSVYRKPIFSGLYIRWYSFSLKRTKINLIITLVHRTLMIRSKTRLDSELDKIRAILIENG